MWALLSVLFLLVLLGSLIGLVFKRVRRKAGWTVLAGFVGLVASVIFFSGEMDENARQRGFVSAADLQQAQKAGITDPTAWRTYQEKLRADEQAVAEAKRKAQAELEARRAELLRPPTDQVSFMRAIERGRAQYKNGQTDLQRGSARPTRAKEICSASSGPQVNGWIGTISQLSTNGDGNGVLSIKLADRLHLATWNNSLSDIASDTLIKADSSLYRALLSMKVGELVRVYGRMFQSSQDCFRETSLTMSGSLDDPTFLMRFSRIDRVVLP